MKYISSMDSDTTRWMNKRRPKNSVAIPRHIMPGIAIQLKQLFDNIDVDQSGEIDLTELKQAVKFVSDACPEIGGKCYSAQDTKAITNFFRSMDVNHNGVVDFVEFLAAVTATRSNDNNGNNNGNNGSGSGSSGSVEKIAQVSHRLQAAFIQFATQLRRQRLAKNVFNDHLSSNEKIDALKQLYSINYFMDVGLEEGSGSSSGGGSGSGTTADKQWQVLNGNVLHERKKRELQRAREAAALLKAKRTLAPINEQQQQQHVTKMTMMSPPPPCIIVHRNDVIASTISHLPLAKIRSTHHHHHLPAVTSTRTTQATLSLTNKPTV
eukprot:gene9030-9965_t